VSSLCDSGLGLEFVPFEMMAVVAIPDPRSKRHMINSPGPHSGINVLRTLATPLMLFILAIWGDACLFCTVDLGVTSCSSIVVLRCHLLSLQPFHSSVRRNCSPEIHVAAVAAFL
jgi:hypothetical protein